MLLEDIYNKHHYVFAQGPMTWQESVKKSIEPLVADGTCDPCYADEIIACIEKHGPYIIITPNVAMPHSTENAKGAHKTAISFMHTDTPVSFDDNDPDAQVQTFFTLCATDPSEHLKNMQNLVSVLMNEEVLEKLKHVESPEELLEINKLVDYTA